ncbi:MAG: aromatic ring-hydroxylating dioxygenase subunit alpha [Gammaproteobacteria bacterium]|nr:aromatic ring-hydroxylating dioxygenase subunit alpha [Gammaproteobacteria bacterium]
MTRTTDTSVLEDWQAIGRSEDVPLERPRRTRLLGQDILVERHPDGLRVFELDAGERRLRSARVQERYGHVFVSLGEDPRPLLELPEFEQPGRRLITSGIVTVRASPLRIVENFLDMAHFPYVHTNILGAEPHTEVLPYNAEIRRGVDEVWATGCQFYQQQAAMSAEGGQQIAYEYRVSSPFITVLYKTCPERADEWDLIGLLVQPLEEDLCDVHTFMLLFDSSTPDIALVHFQQTIFIQDRSILENQRPRLMPLEAGAERPVRADLTSSTYRRWLRARGVSFGALKSHPA